MKYLYQDCLSELCDSLYLEDGLVKLGSLSWNIEQLIGIDTLSGKTNDIFDVLFSDWLQPKRDLAQGILNTDTQRIYFKELIDAHRNSHVVPFIGAGMSIPSGYPGWTQFLYEQHKEANLKIADFDELISNGQYEKLAQLLADNREAVFDKNILNIYSNEKDIAGPIGLIADIFDKGVITTNFDTIIERCFAKSGSPFDKESTLTGLNSRSFRRTKITTNHWLLKLHGSPDPINSRIFTQAEYDKSYGSDSPIIRTVQILYDNYVLLFLGCSLANDRFLSVCREYVFQEGHASLPCHYAFLEMPLGDSDRKRRQDELSKYHIYPIWYPPGTHDESIEALLIKLHEDAQQ